MADKLNELGRRNWRISFGFWAGPILWGLQILAGYGLATVSCYAANRLPVLLIIGVAGLIVLVAAGVAYSAWRAQPDAERSIFMETDEADPTARFLSVSGFVLSLLFFLLILATFVSDLFLATCPIITMPLP